MVLKSFGSQDKKPRTYIKLHIYLIIESERQWTEIRQLFAYSFRKAMDFIN
jgi:hypothetical protein